MSRRFLSLGAGVQSTAMLLMARDGEFEERPEAALFADTGWEPPEVYKHFEWLRDEVSGDIPVYTVRHGNLRDDALNGSNFATMPLYVRDAEGKKSMLRRQCTREYKIDPIQKKIRALCGYKPRQRIHDDIQLWLGISLDEALRMKTNRIPWITNRWPLVERKLTRQACLRWLSEHGYPKPPKSACIGCPFHDKPRWQQMKRDEPSNWADAVEFDNAIRMLPRISGEAFLHRDAIALEDVDMSTPEDHGQMPLELEFCDEGMCFV